MGRMAFIHTETYAHRHREREFYPIVCVFFSRTERGYMFYVVCLTMGDIKHEKNCREDKHLKWARAKAWELCGSNWKWSETEWHYRQLNKTGENNLNTANEARKKKTKRRNDERCEHEWTDRYTERNWMSECVSVRQRG